MKSIYEEALENLNVHEHQLEYTKIFERKFDLLKKVKQALEQAQHQEELLWYYKELAELRKELYDLTINFKPSNKDRMTILFIRENLLSDIIRGLEK